VLSLSPAVKLWFCPPPVDMRLGFDGLFALVRSRLQADPLSGHLCLWCQRLEAGRYHFPDASANATSIELSAGQFQMILDGIDLSQVKRFKRFTPPT
jgi:transposase